MKMTMLRDAGYTQPVAIAYSDSSADLPLLQAAQHPVVVNPKASRVAMFRRVLPPGTPILNWGCPGRAGDCGVERVLTEFAAGRGPLRGFCRRVLTASTANGLISQPPRPALAGGFCRGGLDPPYAASTANGLISQRAKARST